MITEQRLSELIALVPNQHGTTILTTALKTKLVNQQYAASEILSKVELKGWNYIGQWLVYGHERYLSFSKAIELCSVIERKYKSMRRKKELDTEVLRDLYVVTLINLFFHGDSNV